MKKNRKKFEKLLSLLKESNFLQVGNQSNWIACIPKSVFIEFLKGNYVVKAVGINPISNSYYETTVDVVKVYGYFIGIRMVSESFDEEVFDGEGFEISFFEMKKKKSIRYEVAYD